MTKSKQNKTFGLHCARDYFAKLEWEHDRLCGLIEPAADEMTYSFINFSITAWHLVDWVETEMSKEQLTELTEGTGNLKDYVLKNSEDVAMCREVANAGKHFEITRNPNPTIATIPATAAASFKEAPEGTLLFWVVTINGKCATLIRVANNSLVFWRDFFDRYQGNEKFINRNNPLCRVSPGNFPPSCSRNRT